MMRIKLYFTFFICHYFSFKIKKFILNSAFSADVLKRKFFLRHNPHVVYPSVEFCILYFFKLCSVLEPCTGRETFTALNDKWERRGIWLVATSRKKKYFINFFFKTFILIVLWIISPIPNSKTGKTKQSFVFHLSYFVLPYIKHFSHGLLAWHGFLMTFFPAFRLIPWFYINLFSWMILMKISVII